MHTSANLAAAFYQSGGRDARSRQRLLAEHAAALGLSFAVKPMPEDVDVLTERAWTRDGTPRRDAAARRLRLPWIISGWYARRQTAVFMVNRALGSVIAARAATDGPVVRVFSRYGVTTWTGAIGLACYLVVGAAAAWILGPCRLPARRGAITVGDDEFARRFSVICTDPEHARTLLTSRVQRLLLEGDGHGAAWWSIGLGWVSCVSRYEQVNRAHGRVMTREAIKASLDLVTRIAGELDGGRPLIESRVRNMAA